MPPPDAIHGCPHDFEAFWARALGELDDVAVEWERVPASDGEAPDHTVDWIRFPSVSDVDIYGWIASPSVRQKTDRFPANLWLPGYSYGNPPPGPESLYTGMVTFGINVHGFAPDTPYVHPSASGAEYITSGIEASDTYIFRKIVQHCLRALEVLSRQPDVDPAQLWVSGMSQGGGLALLTASLDARTKACCADMPWLCNLPLALSLIDRSRYAGKPNLRVPDGRVFIADLAEAHPDKAEAIFRAYAYVDPINHASRIRCPVQLTAGSRDPSCKPPTIRSLFDVLTCPKDFHLFEGVGHEIIPAMHEAHEKWVQEHL